VGEGIALFLRTSTRHCGGRENEEIFMRESEGSIGYYIEMRSIGMAERSRASLEFQLRRGHSVWFLMGTWVGKGKRKGEKD